MKEVKVDEEKLEAVPEFCYLGDMISAGGGCELAAVTRCKCAWGKFRQLLPLLTNCNVPLVTRGRVYSTCVRSVMLHAAETWAITAAALNRSCNDPLDLQCQGEGRSQLRLPSLKAWHPGPGYGAPNQ